YVVRFDFQLSSLSYAAFLAGAFPSANGLALDGKGGAYITGLTWSGLQVANAIQPAYSAGGSCVTNPDSANYPCPDAFAAKFDTVKGNLVYSTYLGGTKGDGGNGIAADLAGNAYVAGTTDSSDFPVANAYQTSFGGGGGGGGDYFAVSGDAFVAKIAAAATVRIEQDNPAITYSGTWYTHPDSRESGGRAGLALDAGIKASVNFNGTGITWIGLKDEYSGIAQVYIDGVLQGTV